jgi:hypothetical protein
MERRQAAVIVSTVLAMETVDAPVQLVGQPPPTERSARHVSQVSSLIQMEHAKPVR